MSNITKEGDDIMTNRKVQSDYIKIKHPDYGYVEFRGMSFRQLEILRDYKRITNGNIKKN